MKCPYCKAEDDKEHTHRVLRPYDYGIAIKRRRRCWHCKKTFTTWEEYAKEKTSNDY